MIPLPYKILAIVLIAIGAFGYGMKLGTDKAKVEIERFAVQNEQLKNDLEKEQNNIKEKVVTEFIDRVKVVKEKEYVFLNQAENNVPAQFNLSNGWVYLHDAATGASGGNADPTRSSDATASDIKDNQALATIISNYSACLQNSQQLIGLQKWALESKQAIDKQNESRGIKLPWSKK